MFTKGTITEILIDEDQIQARVAELAAEIQRDYQGEKVLAVCLLKGSLLFTGDLIRRVELPVVLDVMRASSYSGTRTESSGSVKVLQDLDSDIAGEHVLVVEDIVDTGRTLKKILALLKVRNPKSLKVCALLDKPSRRVEDVPIDYVGFTIEDHFVVGYGLDYDEEYRNLPYIGILNPQS